MLVALVAAVEGAVEIDSGSTRWFKDLFNFTFKIMHVFWDRVKLLKTFLSY